MSEFRDISELFEAETAENGPENELLVLPDPHDGAVEWACWLCQKDEPAFTLELIHNESGKGNTYQLCPECAERLLGTLEEGKESDE